MTTPTPPYTCQMSMADYHASPGASKSQLDLVRLSPALVQWAKEAPEDEEAESAVNVGTALHKLLLEPRQFHDDYVLDFEAPEHGLATVEQIKGYMKRASIPFAGLTTKGDLTAELLRIIPGAPVVDALREQWALGIGGREVLDRAEYRKLTLMRDSVMAHPTARKMLEASGHSERCHFWIDEATGELCRCRLDREIPLFQTVVDIKTSATIDRFDRSVAQYRYHVQAAFYGNGYAATQGNPPLVFVFLVVSTVRDRRRYPVRLFTVNPADMDIAQAAIREDLATWAECRKTGVWHGIETVSLPMWS